MAGELVELVAANTAFVGSHFAMSHPLRAPMVRVLSEAGFAVVYSLVSIAALAWVYFAFKAAPPMDLGGSGTAGWIIASALMVPAMILFAGSLAGNPALPHPGAKKHARGAVRGVFKVTRHPLMWSFGLWALSHIVLWWSWRTTVTALAMGFLALLGAHLQDRKKRVTMGEVWAQWEGKTSFFPRVSAFFSVGMLWWAVGLMLWVLLSWAHWPLGGIAAGIWRWF